MGMLTIWFNDYAWYVLLLCVECQSSKRVLLYLFLIVPSRLKYTTVGIMGLLVLLGKE